MALLPLLVALPILLGIALYLGDEYFNQLLINKVRSDLAVANQYFDRSIDRIGLEIRGVAESAALADAQRKDDVSAMAAMLTLRAGIARLDYLQLLNNKGVVIASSRQNMVGRDRSHWPVVTRALQGTSSSKVDIVQPSDLSAMGTDLAEQAELRLLPTENAASSNQTIELRGMAIHSAAPLLDDQGRIIGALEGGLLLNRNLAFVDSINDLVYPPDGSPDGVLGTATLFLDDIRIATNVRMFRGERALGTRVSTAVRDRVLKSGHVWLGRAFVVSDWYISGYRPITDSFGRPAGMLYVGFLEEPFVNAKRTISTALIAITALFGLAGSLLMLRLARGIFRPVERMNLTMSAIEHGDLSARTGADHAEDELGELARHFDRLLDQFQTQHAELRDLATQLDKKVEARTRDLVAANQLLRETQEQLVLSERLAALGELTACIAHEINNPIAVIQGHLDLARENLGQAVSLIRDDLCLVDEQIHRINVIVTRLLQFAKPTEFADYVDCISPADVVRDCLVLVKHLVTQYNVEVSLSDSATRMVEFNRSELLQVLINLTTNAIHAMPGRGTLAIECRDWNESVDRCGVEIAVSDTGRGIRQEDLPRIFRPFYSTKGNQGTGLGLSICATLVARYGGAIAVSSEEERGTTFTVRLLSAPTERLA